MITQKPLPQVSKSYKAQTRFLFYCHIKIKLPVVCHDFYFDELFAELERIDRRYNSYSESSFISKINKNAGHFTEVDEFTIELLQQVKQLSSYFQGAYDITSMPLLKLWGLRGNKVNKIPRLTEIEAAQQLVNYQNIQIEGNRVKIESGQEINTGSFLKAYAIDQILDKLKKDGITDAMINAGGSTIVGINDNEHPNWKVNVPNITENTDLFQLKLKNNCFSTSATNTHSNIIEGKEFGHIINATTGCPSSNYRVGLLTDSCFLGDVLATGLFAIPSNHFLVTLHKIQQDFKVEGFLINEQGGIISSKNFPVKIDRR
ncbi:MAG: FAD:protein FMN transferase [Mesonia sp.]|uniref:FAD:protein FMN transferase n=1 Tax=Mesonia sp. TaxID=1960830 RepID=UPI00324235C2